MIIPNEEQQLAMNWYRAHIEEKNGGFYLIAEYGETPISYQIHNSDLDDALKRCEEDYKDWDES